MKSIKFVPLFLLLAVILSACSAQPTATSSLIGSTAPDFQLDNTSGGQTKLSDYQGSPVLLFFHMAVG
jgi:cytochrome oxidase Cu insertion factor (SCO1/SenC/PrrC family)